MRHKREQKGDTEVIEHPFVAVLQEEVSARKRQYSAAVREGRMDPKIARERFNLISDALEFMQAMAVRYDGERAYEAGHIVPATTGAMASADCRARKLWESWRSGTKEQEIAA